MIVTIILHTIAAILWFISLVLALGVGSQLAKEGSGSIEWPLAICIFVAVCAFILQVIA